MSKRISEYQPLQEGTRFTRFIVINSLFSHILRIFGEYAKKTVFLSGVEDENYVV